MPFVLDGERGRVESPAACSRKSRVSLDRVAQQPVAKVERSGKSGSFVRVDWPDSKLAHATGDEGEFVPLDGDLADRVLELALGFAHLNPT